jgi:hypothetical protein
MNPTAIFAAIILWGASIAGTFFYGQGVGKDGEIAKQAQIEKAITDTREAARLGAADEIAKIKVRHTTVQGKVETVIRDNPVYRDCLHSPDSVRLINEALTGRGGPASGGELPGVVAPK